VESSLITMQNQYEIIIVDCDNEELEKALFQINKTYWTK
jgi:hypothetical protein